MGIQISLKLPEKMFASAKDYAEYHGFGTVQEFIRELIRERLFNRESEALTGVSTSQASEEALGRHWLRPEEDQVWAHLQKEM